MKLSNGSVAEFILGIFFVFAGFNTGEIISMLIMVILGGLASGHCVYCWIKKGKENKSNKKSDSSMK